MADRYLNMSPGEKVILVAYRHWINVLPVFVSSALVIIAGLLAINYVSVHPDIIGFHIPLSVVTLLVFMLDFLVVAIAAVSYLIFRQNRIILTNMHFIQINQSGLFGRTLSKLSLDELQDVKGSRSGVFATIFGYGEILTETAGAQENFLFRPVGDPLNVAEIINDTHEAYEASMGKEGDADKAPA